MDLKKQPKTAYIEIFESEFDKAQAQRDYRDALKLSQDLAVNSSKFKSKFVLLYSICEVEEDATESLIGTIDEL